MDNFNDKYLSTKQKLKLAGTVFVIYWPIRQYINHSPLGWQTVKSDWLIWIVEVFVTIIFFTLWLSLTEWLEKIIFKGKKVHFLNDFRWPVQLFILVVAGFLAISFNIAYHRLWHLVDNRYLQDAYTEIVQPQSISLGKNDYDNGNENSLRDFRGRTNDGLTLMAMLSVFYLAANFRASKQLEALKVNAEQLKREAAQAQFFALKNQVSPHFLFNSLSILSSLVEIDTKLSVQFIQRLSKTFRYILDQRDAQIVSLKTELEFLDSYAFLLNIRFEGKLIINNSIKREDAVWYNIAPLTLQLLVENAVKHNQMSKDLPLKVDIRIENEYLILENKIQLRPQTVESTGVGLQNIINRYKLLTELPVVINQHQGLFVVQIPLLK